MKPVTERRTRILNHPSCLLLASLILLPEVAAPAATEPEVHEGFLAAKGRVTYRVYCANCHGSDAQGRGNIAKFLTVEPTDLTRLSEKNDGEFPAEHVRRVIDGLEEVAGHGRREMPIWGDVFKTPLVSSSGDEGDEERAKNKIRELVLYLKSLQKVRQADSP